MIFSIGRPQYFISHNTHNMSLGCLWYAPFMEQTSKCIKDGNKLQAF